MRVSIKRFSIKVAALMILIPSLVVVCMLRSSRTLSQLQGVPNTQQAALAAAEKSKNLTSTYFDEVNGSSNHSEQAPLAAAEKSKNSTRTYFDEVKNGSLNHSSTVLLEETHQLPAKDEETNHKNDEYCTPDPHQPVYKVSGRFAENQFFDTSSAPATRRNEPLVCEYKTDNGMNWFHFPHSMQQLYACYSFYQQPLDEEGDRPKFLLVSSRTKSQLDKNNFLKGYFQLLQNEMGVEILDQNSLYEKYNQTGVNVSSAAFYIRDGYIISHVHELNQLAHNYLFKMEEMTTFERPLCGMKDRDDDSPAAVLFPRIGILNRMPNKGRSITYPAQLVNTLANISFHHQVDLEYFESSSFEEQVKFFQRTDILISPHGAQLTGLPFLAKNGKCSQLLEIFPPKYLIPAFFGSLARHSDIGYSYLYLSDQAANYSWPKSLQERNQARAVNLCVSQDVIRKTIERLVGDWRTCCQDRANE